MTALPAGPPHLSSCVRSYISTLGAGCGLSAAAARRRNSYTCSNQLDQSEAALWSRDRRMDQSGARNSYSSGSPMDQAEKKQKLAKRLDKGGFTGTWSRVDLCCAELHCTVQVTSYFHSTVNHNFLLS